MEGYLDCKGTMLMFSAWTTKWCMYEESSQQMTTYDKKGGARSGIIQVDSVYDIPDRVKRTQHRIEIREGNGSFHSMSAPNHTAKGEWLAMFTRSLGGLSDLNEHPRYKGSRPSLAESNTSNTSSVGSPAPEEVHTSNIAKYSLGQQVTGMPGQGEDGVSGFIVAITPQTPGLTSGPGVLLIAAQPLRQSDQWTSSTVETNVVAEEEEEEEEEEEMLFDPETGEPIGGAAAGGRWGSDTAKFDPETGLPIGGPAAREWVGGYPRFATSANPSDDTPMFDPETGEPLAQAAAAPFEPAAAVDTSARADTEELSFADTEELSDTKELPIVEVDTGNVGKYNVGQQVKGLVGGTVSGYILRVIPDDPAGVMEGPGFLEIGTLEMLEQQQSQVRELVEVDTSNVGKYRVGQEVRGMAGGTVNGYVLRMVPADPGGAVNGPGSLVIGSLEMLEQQEAKDSKSAPVAPHVKKANEIWKKPRAAGNGDEELTLSKLGLRYDLFIPEVETRDSTLAGPPPLSQSAPSESTFATSMDSHSVDDTTNLDVAQSPQQQPEMSSAAAVEMPRFDPETGAPLGAPVASAAPTARFDPETGERIA
jgi:hypothetical protein